MRRLIGMKILAMLVGLMFVVGCGGDTEVVAAAQDPVDESEPAQESDPDVPAELRIVAVAQGGGFGGFEPPPWDQFAIELAPVAEREQITAVGEGSTDGGTPLGGSCEQLLADFPELTGCTEYTDVYAEAGTYVTLDETLNAEGELTIPSLEATSRLVIFAVDPTDEYCDWYGSADIEPGQSLATLEVDLSCA